MADTTTRESVPRHPSRYVLLVAGGAALALGSLALSGVRDVFDRYLPAATVAVGLAALWASFVPHAAGRATPRERGTASPSRPEPVSTAEPARPADRSPPPGTLNVRPSAPEKRTRGVPRSTVARAGDELWSHWATPKTSLGAALVGPVPETAYSPSRSGAVAPFVSKDRDVQVLSNLIRRPKGTAPSSSYADIAIRPSPAAGASKGGAAEPNADRARAPFREVGSYFGGSVELLPLLDSLEYESDIVADTPSPEGPRPKLNSRAQEWLDRATGHRARHTLARFCSGCSRRLDDFRDWVHCRECREPICQECLGESYSTNDRGLCTDCRAANNPPTDLVTRTIQSGRSLAPKWIGT